MSHLLNIPVIRYQLSSSSSTPNFQTFAPLQPSQWRQRIVHTHTSKIYEYGNGPADLMVEEVDSSGHSRGNGIVGHVRDRHGNQVDSWHQAAQLASFGAVILVHLKIPIYIMITILMMGLNQ